MPQSPRVVLVWYWRVRLDHLGSTSWLLEARSERTSHCQILLELPLRRARYFRKGSTTILPAASMLVPLMSRLMVDAVFWFTRQTARVNGGLSRNDSLRAGTCLRRVHLRWRQCHHRRGDIDIHHEHSTRSSVGCSSRQSAASSGGAPPPSSAPSGPAFLRALVAAGGLLTGRRFDQKRHQGRFELCTPRNTSWSWRTECTHSEASQLWQVSENFDNFQVRDPWRTPRTHKQPTLPLPKPEGPEPVCSHHLLPTTSNTADQSLSRALQRRSGRIPCAQGQCVSVDWHWYHWFVLTFNGHFS